MDAQPIGLGRPGRGLSTCKVPATAAKRAGSEAGTKYSVSAGFSNFVQTREGYPRLWQYEVRVTVRAPTPDDMSQQQYNPRAFSQRASVQYSTRTVLYLLISHFVLVRVPVLYLIIRTRLVPYSTRTASCSTVLVPYCRLWACKASWGGPRGKGAPTSKGPERYLAGTEPYRAVGALPDEIAPKSTKLPRKIIEISPKYPEIPRIHRNMRFRHCTLRGTYVGTCTAPDHCW